MNVTASGFGLALEAIFPWWAICSRFLSGDDGAKPGEDHAREEKAGETELLDAEPGANLEAFWRGDDPTVEAIYRKHARRLLGAARLIVGAAEAESVVHEVFVELIRNEELRRRFTGGSLGAWLAAIARHKSLEHLRRTGRAPISGEVPAGGAHTSPEPQLEARNLLMRFLKVGVPEEQAEFFRRRFLDGRTQVEVAAALGIPRSTLEGWEHRLAERLRRFVWESSQ